jgi:hypothetical protein
MSTVLNPDPPGRVPSVSGRNRIINRTVKPSRVYPENPGHQGHQQEALQEEEEV